MGVHFEPENKDAWTTYLEKHGYVVLKNAISKEDSERAKTMLMEELATISPGFKPEDKTSWITANFPGVAGKGTLVFNGMAQSNSNWLARQNSAARMAFATLYGISEDQLVTSFDGASLFWGTNQQSPAWWHQDQNTSKPGPQERSYQAILCLTPRGRWDAGFNLVPGSHLSYRNPQPPKSSDWVPVPKGDPIAEQGIRLGTEENTLIVFDSRLVHTNSGMLKNHPNKKPHINRLAYYTTFVPRERQTDTIRQKRIEAYFTGEAHSHYAGRVEPKKLPFHLARKFKGFNQLKPETNLDGSIPADRLALI